MFIRQTTEDRKVIKQVKRNNPKGVALMPNHFNFLSGAGKRMATVGIAPVGKINTSSTGYKSARNDKLRKQREEKKVKRAAWRKRQALKRAA